MVLKWLLRTVRSEIWSLPSTMRKIMETDRDRDLWRLRFFFPFSYSRNGEPPWFVLSLSLSPTKGTATEWAARAHRMFLKLPSLKFLEEFDFRFYVDSFACAHKIKHPPPRYINARVSGCNLFSTFCVYWHSFIFFVNPSTWRNTNYPHVYRGIFSWMRTFRRVRA